VTYNGGFTLGLFAFTAAVLGGIGNIRGAVLGGLLIGVITIWVDSLGNGGGTAWYEVAVFLILVLILVFRPAGILGTNVAEKV
jgi:branched-chain amino acid transport system permease protein